MLFASRGSFAKILKENTNPHILVEAIDDYPGIVSSRQAKIAIDETLSRARKESIDVDSLLAENAQYFQQLGLAFANPDMQDEYLPALLKSIQGAGQGSKPHLMRHFMRWLPIYSRSLFRRQSDNNYQRIFYCRKTRRHCQSKDKRQTSLPPSLLIYTQDTSKCEVSERDIFED